MKLRAIVTGATGMVGEGVLQECLENPEVEVVLVLGRKSCGVSHPKLKEVLHNNFYDLSAIADKLSGYNACFFCLGVSSVGMKEADYYKVTYTLTMHVAETLVKRNTDMSFCYVSGAATDSTEKGRSMWARVKGKTENDLMKLPFKGVYNFRPGFMKAAKGARNTPGLYKAMQWMYPFLRAAFPKFACTLKEVAQAMIYVSSKRYEKHILEVTDIVAIAKM
jgi:uncharacterized protein YbjT (DUF2867 family)